MDKYKFLDTIMSDVMFEAYGKDFSELCCNSAEAMFSVICKIDKVDAKDEFLVEVKGDSYEETLWNFLSEMIAMVDIEEHFFSKFDVIKADENHVKAKIYGEPILPQKGETVVKSLTNYKFEVSKVDEKFKAVVCVDI